MRLTFLGAAILALSFPVAPVLGSSSYVVRDETSGLKLVDPGLADPEAYRLPADGRPLRLSLPFEAPGGYRGIEVSAHGWARLVAEAASTLRDPAGRPVVVPVAQREPTGDVGAPAGTAPLLFRVFAAPLVSPPQARLYVQSAPELLILRWNGFGAGASRTPATFELLLDPAGNVRYQYYVVPEAGSESVEVGYETAAAGRVTLVRPGSGSRLRGGSVFELRPGEAAPLGEGPRGAGAATCTSCGVEAPWCTQARASSPTCTAYIDGTTCAKARGLGRSCCSDTASASWSFWENRFCLGCSYTFYALVECGTEMHIPLDDMEGARVRVTEFLTGRPVPLTCRNQQYQVPGFHLVNCDRAPAGVGPEDSYYDSPAFHQSNAADPSQYVSWGFDDAVPCATAADTRNCAIWTPGTGTLAVSPGEQQVTDCVIAEPTGLCGLYRIDVVSGGYAWKLFANCDGTNTPRYQIFDSCADACAAYAPRPELTVMNLRDTGECPNARVEFDLGNIGCAAAGPVRYRIHSNCVPADVKDGLHAGVLGANSVVHVVEPLSLSCTPATITVTVDPDDEIADECSESSSAYKCNSIPGQTSLDTTTCGCEARLTPRLARASVACSGRTLVLDGGASTAVGCAGRLEYRWVNAATNGVACPWSATPSCEPPGQPLAEGSHPYRLDVRCTGEPVCVRSLEFAVDVYGDPRAGAGPDQETCLGIGVLLGGDGVDPTGSGGSGSFRYTWSPAAGLSSTGVANPVFTPPGEGEYGFEVLVEDVVTGCTASDTVAVKVHPGLVASAGADRVQCLGSPASVALGGSPSAAGGAGGGYGYRWTILSGASPSELSSLAEANPAYTPKAGNDPGGAELELRVTDAAGCLATSRVRVQVNRLPDVHPGATATFCVGDRVRLGSFPSGACHQDPGGACEFLWSPAGSLDCATCPNPWATPTRDTAYTLRVTDATSRCAAEASVLVRLDNDPGQPPPELGNVLLERRDGRDVELVWLRVGSSVGEVNVRRSEAKPFTSSSVVAGRVGSRGWKDPGAVVSAPPRFFYRVGAITCSGVEGPY